MSTPLSLEQQLYFDMCAADYRHRTITTVRRLRGVLDLAAFTASVTEVVNRHDALRTRVDRRGEPVQHLGEPIEEFPVRVVTGFSAEELDKAIAEAWRLVSAEIAVAADGPLRVELVQLAEDDHLLAMAEHDIAADSWSSALVLSEILAAYRHRVAGGPALEPVPGTFAGHIAEQAAAGEHLTEEQLSFWRTAFTGSSVDVVDPARRRDEGVLTRLDSMLDTGTTSAVRAFAAKSKATPFALTLAAAAAAVAGEWGQSALRLTTALLGRDGRGSRELAGVFHRLADIRVDVLAGQPLRELARAAMRSTMDSTRQAAAPYSYTRLLAELAGEEHTGAAAQLHRIRTGEGGRALNVAFEFFLPGEGNVPSTVDASLSVEPVDLSAFSTQVRYNAYDVIFIVGFATEVYLGVFYNDEVVPAATAARLVERMSTVLRTCTPDNPNLTVADVPDP
ncbi:condensation domain-containing protein [Crossiella sp. CA198]|uniref:condensation domain-containing protein n=1 Tax=Crossiella sp. CA198 TaxID=3455607 RepID=UPI003F8D0044